MTGLTASGNYTVAQSRKTTIEDSTVTASGNSDLTGRVVVLMNSSRTGSASGIDLLTQRRPRVVNSTCEVSRILQNPTETWGVRSHDVASRPAQPTTHAAARVESATVRRPCRMALRSNPFV